MFIGSHHLRHGQSASTGKDRHKKIRTLTNWPRKVLTTKMAKQRNKICVWELSLAPQCQLASLLDLLWKKRKRQRPGPAGNRRGCERRKCPCYIQDVGIFSQIPKLPHNFRSSMISTDKRAPQKITLTHTQLPKTLSREAGQALWIGVLLTWLHRQISTQATPPI